MNKIVLTALLVIFAIFLVIVFLVLKKEAKFCQSYNEIQCKASLFCKAVGEYGLDCGEDGCQEGERFTECSPRF